MGISGSVPWFIAIKRLGKSRVFCDWRWSDAFRTFEWNNLQKYNHFRDATKMVVWVLFDIQKIAHRVSIENLHRSGRTLLSNSLCTQL